MADDLVKSIIALRHAAYTQRVEDWRLAEKRLRGGKVVTEDLTPFEYEDTGSDAFKRRQSRAIYLPLPSETGRKFVDSVSREAPRPGEALPERALSFGGLGLVRPALGGVAAADAQAAADGTGLAGMTNAEMVWTNVDGVGDDGSGWDPWWDGVQIRAMATGFRWVGVEASLAKPVSQADEENGMRPYAVEFSPTATPFWSFSNGTLQVLLVETSGPQLTLDGGKVVVKDKTQFLLYVRAGYQTFGPRFAVGGWWLFDEAGDPVVRADGSPSEGRWDSTGGAIPFTRFFYERDPLDVSGARPGLDEVAAIALGLMDLEADARNDAHVGGGRMVFATNVDENGHKVAVDQLTAGSRFVGVPAAPGATSAPTLMDMGAASASEAIEKEMDRLWGWFKSIATKELTTSPDASGIAKTVEYEAEASPRLAYMASMRGEAQAFILRMFELRWGITGPTSSVRYPRRYSLDSVLARLVQAIGALQAAGVASPTLQARLAKAVVAEAGVGLSDAEQKTVQDEITAGAERAAKSRAATEELLG